MWTDGTVSYLANISQLLQTGSEGRAVTLREELVPPPYKHLGCLYFVLSSGGEPTILRTVPYLANIAAAPEGQRAEGSHAQEGSGPGPQTNRLVLRIIIYHYTNASRQTFFFSLYSYK